MDIRRMESGEAEAVATLVMASFSECVAADYGPEGVETFTEFARPASLIERDQTDHSTLVAEADGRLLGMVQLQRPGHVRMLFVAPDMQRQGIGRALLDAALEIAARQHPDVTTVTVNSSPYAVEPYRRMGFAVVGPPEIKCGVISIPMTKQIPRDV
jgi:ribosomal protein S18 acetylase RimI-like enzyme